MRRVFPEQSEEHVNVKLRNQVRNSFNYWRRALQFDREARYWGKRVSAGHKRRKATATTSVCSDADTSLDTSGLGASTSSQSTASTCESQPSAVPSSASMSSPPFPDMSMSQPSESHSSASAAFVADVCDVPEEVVLDAATQDLFGSAENVADV